MKRMNEVFELSLAVSEYLLVEGAGNRCAEFNLEIEAQHAAHAINHVDALADALEALLPHIESHRELGRLGEIAQDAAQAALKAYRGEK